MVLRPLLKDRPITRRHPSGAGERSGERRVEWFLGTLAGLLIVSWVAALLYAALAPQGTEPTILNIPLRNAGHTQGLTTLILFSAYVSFRFFTVRQDSGFWTARPTRTAVGAIGWGTVISLGCYTGETLLPMFVEMPRNMEHYLQVAMPALLHLTGATIVILCGTAFWFSLSILYDTVTPFRRFAAIMLSPGLFYPLVLVPAMIGLGLAFGIATGRIPTETYDLRADLSMYGNLYRFFANSFAAFYAFLIATVLHVAHVTGANGPAFARRWKYLKFGMLGFASLEAIAFLVPLLAEARPGTVLAAHPGALCRLGEVPSFALIGWGAFCGFAGAPSRSPSGRRRQYIDLYKTTLEDLERLVLSLEPRRISQRQNERYLLSQAGPNLSKADLDRAAIVLSLLRLSVHPIHSRRLSNKLYLLDFLNRTFLSLGRPGTEIFHRAENDTLSPLAKAASNLICRPSSNIGQNSIPEYARPAQRLWRLQNYKIPEPDETGIPEHAAHEYDTEHH